MAEPKRPGAKARNAAAGRERIGRYLRAMENLQPVAERVVGDDQILDQTLVCERARAAGNHDPCLLEPRCRRIKRRGVGDFPAENADAFATICVDDDALLAVIHAERQHRSALVDPLQAEQPGPIGPPITQILGADADISQSLYAHRDPHRFAAIIWEAVPRGKPLVSRAAAGRGEGRTVW